LEYCVIHSNIIEYVLYKSHEATFSLNRRVSKKNFLYVCQANRVSCLLNVV
jgi:hypothetical protein